MDEKFSILRKRVKHSQKKVMDCIIADHNADICVLCGSSDDITREHIIPQWAVESNAEKSLINKKNNQSTHYIKATVPACRVCNSDLLGVFDAYSALFDHGLASKSDQRFASIRSTGNLTFSTAF